MEQERPHDSPPHEKDLQMVRSLDSDDLSSIKNNSHEMVGQTLGLKDLEGNPLPGNDMESSIAISEREQEQTFTSLASINPSRLSPPLNHYMKQQQPGSATPLSRNQAQEHSRQQQSTGSLNYQQNPSLLSIQGYHQQAHGNANQSHHYTNMSAVGGTNAAQGQLDPNTSMTRQSVQQQSALRQEQDQLQQMMKQVRDEKAQLTKKQAVLEQQTELLKLQLTEAQTRERTQREMQEKMAQVLREQLSEAQHKLDIERREKEVISEDNPKVKEILHQHQNLAQEKLYLERETFQQKLFTAERQLQTSQYELQNAQRELQQLKHEHSNEVKQLESDLKRQDFNHQQECRSIKERMADRCKELENELESQRQDEQTERYSLLNKHMEQAQQLNQTISKLQRENQELSQLCKQTEIERDVGEDHKQQMIKELDMRMEDIQDLEQAVSDSQFQLQALEDNAKTEQSKMREEIDRLVEQSYSLQDKLSKADNQCKQLLNSKVNPGKAVRPVGNSSGRSSRDTYFTANAQSVHKQNQGSAKASAAVNKSLTQQNSSRSLSNQRNQKQSTPQPFENISYTKMCKDFDNSMDMTMQQALTGDENDKITRLQQLVAHYRSTAKRLEVQHNDLKLKYHQETEKLTNQVQHEKRKRAQLYEEKIERSESLLQQITEKDTQLMQLTKKLAQVQSQSVMPLYGNQTVTTQVMVPGNDTILSSMEYNVLAQQQNNSIQQAARKSRDLSAQKRRNSLQKQSLLDQSLQQNTDRQQQRKLTKIGSQKVDLSIASVVKPNQTPKKPHRIIVKRLNQPQQQIPEIEQSDSPFMMSMTEGPTRMPRITTEKKVISSKVSRNDNRIQERLEESEIVNYETCQNQDIQGLDSPTLSEQDFKQMQTSRSSDGMRNEYYTVQNNDCPMTSPTPGGQTQQSNLATAHSIKSNVGVALSLAQQNNAMLDMQNIFTEDKDLQAPSKNQKLITSEGPDLTSSLMSIAQQRFLSSKSSREHTADSQEEARKEPTILQTAPTLLSSQYQTVTGLHSREPSANVTASQPQVIEHECRGGSAHNARRQSMQTYLSDTKIQQSTRKQVGQTKAQVLPKPMTHVRNKPTTTTANTPQKQKQNALSSQRMSLTSQTHANLSTAKSGQVYTTLASRKSSQKPL